MIRSVLECRSSTWSPYYKKDKILLEIVQNRCLRLSKDKITLPTLENRRILYDLCEVIIKQDLGCFPTPHVGWEDTN
jgi:hypothetical protein